MQKININPKLKSKNFYLSVFRKKSFWALFIIFLLAGVFVSIPTSTDSPHSVGIKSGEVASMGQGDVPLHISLGAEELDTVYTSPEYKTDYEFNAVAPHWKETNAEDDSRSVEIRTSPNGRDWSGWLEVEATGPLRDNDPYPDRTFTENPLFIEGRHFQYRLALNRESLTAPSPEISDLKVTYIDSRSSKSQELVKKLSQIKSKVVPDAIAANQNPNVISRAAWGSPDPTGTLFDNTDLDWPPAASPAKQVFIHHTVNSNYQSDPAAVVRGIWEFHAKTRGWGDIGYNYLVDHNGTLYEGRTGGDNIVGAHVLGHNKGSLGVAVIGCFDKDNSTCNQLNGGTTSGPSTAVLHGLTELLAWKTTSFEINPQATHNFCSTDGCLPLYTISGHKDANSTSCPGDLLYNSIPFIRDETARKKASGFGFVAKQVSYPAVTLGDNETTLTLQYKNTGTNTWYNTGANPVRLATANDTDHASVFATSGWLANNRPAVLNETSIAPGQTGSFTFKLSNPPGYLGWRYEYFSLVAEGSSHFGSHFTLPINTRYFTYSYSTQNAYTDNSKSTPLDLSKLSPGQSGWLVLKVINTSNISWSNSGNYPVTLGTDVTRNRNSRYCTADWINCTRPARLTETSVSPGAVGTFEFPIRVPAGGGTFKEYFTPLVEGLTWMNSVGIYYHTNVNNNYSWQFVRQGVYTDSSKTIAADASNLSPGQNFFFTVTARNIGDTMWYRGGMYPMRLGTAYDLNRNSAFRSSSWLSPNRVSAMKEQSVAPGENATFEATFTTPYAGGVHKEYFRPVAENLRWLNDVGLHLPAKVNNSYKWSFITQKAYIDSTRATPIDTSNLSAGQRFYFVVSAQNTGTATWYNSGKYPLRLGTANPRNRTSLFYDSSWQSINRPSSLQTSEVKPGEAGELVGYFIAPTKSGTYKEYMQPVAESAVWLNDLGLYIPATVKD